MTRRHVEVPARTYIEGELRVELEESGGEDGSETEPLVNALPHRRGAEDGERGSGAPLGAH